MIIRCDACGDLLAVPDESGDWVEHHEDGSHTHHVRAAWVGDADRKFRCEHCGDALPSLVSRAAGLPTPDLIRRGFDPSKIVCPECATDREIRTP